MKNYFFYLFALSVFSCNNQQNGEKTLDRKGISSTDTTRPYYTSEAQIDCGISGVPPISIHYSFYQNSTNEILPAEVSQLQTSILKDASTCQIISEMYKRYPSVNNIRVEDKTLSYKKVIVPFTGESRKIETLVNNALPFALNFWRKCALKFNKDRIAFVKYGSNQKIDTIRAFKVILTGGQYVEHNATVRWYVNNQFFLSLDAVRKLGTLGEASQTAIFRRDTDTSYSVSHLVDQDIMIDAVTPKIEEMFESIFFELLHKLVWKRRHESMMETLNSPPYYNSVDPIIAEYTRLDEIAVHYTVICLMKEMLSKGLFPGENTTDPYIKYKNDETYRGLLDLLRKYPPSLQNGEMVIRSFMEDPRKVGKL